MKKSVGILAILILAVALSACGKKAEPTPPQGQSANPSAAAPVAEAPKAEDKGVFASIKDALSKSIPIKCSFTDESGVKSTAYLSKNVIRVEADKNGDMPATHGIVKDNKMYIWSDLTDKGMVIDFSKMKNETAPTSGKDTIRSQDDLIAEIEKKKEDCTKEVVPDSMFELPANIQFAGF
jgi:hypothetical protein